MQQLTLRKVHHLLVESVNAVEQLIERIVFADNVGLDFFGIGEHHREEFLDSAPHMILAAAAARTKRIRLGSAVAVLSAADPVRVFQNYSTLDFNKFRKSGNGCGQGLLFRIIPFVWFSV